MILSRRGFFTGLAAGLGILAAPAIIKTPGLLMPVKAQPKLTVRSGWVYPAEGADYRLVTVTGFGRTGQLVSYQYENAAGERFALIPSGEYVPIAKTVSPQWRGDGELGLKTLARPVPPPSLAMVERNRTHGSPKDYWDRFGRWADDPVLDDCLNRALDKALASTA